MTNALMQSPLFAAVFPYLLLLVLILSVAALGALSRFLHLKAQNTKQSTIIGALANLSTAAESAVLQVESDLRPQVVTLLQDGSVSPAAAAQLRASAIAIAKRTAEGLLAGVVSSSGIKSVEPILGPMVDAAASKLAGNTRNAAAQSQILSLIRNTPPPPGPAIPLSAVPKGDA